MLKVKNISGGDITAGFSVVLAEETFEVAPGHFPALVQQYGKDAFKVITPATEQPAELAPEAAGLEPAKAPSGRGKKGA